LKGYRNNKVKEAEMERREMAAVNGIKEFAARFLAKTKQDESEG
jgi:hypothetical protein